MQNVIKKYWYTALISLIILFGIGLRLKGYLSNSSFCFIEADFTNTVLPWNYNEVFKKFLDYWQLIPPLFSMAIMAFANAWGPYEKIVRIFPVIMSCLSLIGFYFLAAKILSEKYSVVIALILFSINSQLLNYSSVLATYSSDVFSTIICLLFFIYLDIEKLNRYKVLCFGFILAIFPWFSFTSAFIITAGLLNLFFKGFKSDLQKKFLLTVPFIVSVFIYLKQILILPYISKTPIKSIVLMNHDWFINSNAQLIQMIQGNINYLLGAPGNIILCLVLIVLSFLIFLKDKPEFLTISSISFLFVLLGAIFHLYPFFENTTLFLIPIFILFITKTFDLVAYRKNIDLIGYDKKDTALIVIFVSLFLIYSQLIPLRNYIKTNSINKWGVHSREFAHFVMDNLKLDDKILINFSSYPEFSYYSYSCSNEKITKEINMKTLSELKPGHYWLYSPENTAKDKQEIENDFPTLADKITVLKKYKKDASILMYFEVK